MARWEPDAEGRLQEAALALYTERGFDQTTVAEIAERAGLTERTFFRYFADKREVLFGGQRPLLDQLITAVASAPDSASPLEAVSAALEQAAAFFAGRRERSRLRQAVVSANPALRERELIKLAALSEALADGLRRRGVPDTTARLAAEAGGAMFKLAFDQWIAADDERDLAHHVRAAVTELKGLTAG
ncbi:TetR family transcriptional regulator [Mycolicibacterium litorale]|nr:TetR family transcriptional regulator [Mycolicibacterium litorale]